MAERSLLQRFEQAGPLTWLLAAGAAWAVLLWLAALLGLGSAVAPTPTIATVTPLPKARAAAPDRIGPLARYADAASRPLFTQDRRPRSFIATGSDDTLQAQSQSLDFILTGVLISPQVRLAILQPSGGGESQRVREGDAPDGAAGWRLIAVEPRRVVFQGNGGESSLDLRTFGDAGEPSKRSMGDGNTAAIGAAIAAAQAATDAADAAPVAANEAARIDAIRKRIEARRAQMRNADPNRPAPPPPPLIAPPTQ